MRLHKNLVNAAAQAILDVLKNGMVADRYLERLFLQNKQWGARDRNFIANSLYETLRWYRQYASLARQRDMPKNIKESTKLLAYQLLSQGVELPDWAEFAEVRKDPDWAERLARFKENFTVKESYPDWLFRMGMDKMPIDDWQDALSSMNQSAKVVLRTNLLKTSPKELQKILEKENITTHLFKDDALILEGKAKFSTCKSYQEGLFELQDFSSQQVLSQLQLNSDSFIIDACAGAGGKSLHAASLLKNQGKILSLDINARKLEQLDKRAQRAAVKNLSIEHIQDPKQLLKWYGKADALIIDAPCSGTGVIRRQPESKWQLNPKFVTEIVKTQEEILQNYSFLVKPKGQMIYATCSILPQENQEQIEKFLHSKQGQKFKLVKQKTTLPQEQGFDGFYWALLKKK